VTLTERDEAHGLIAQRDFGGTKKWRTCYASDGTGHAMLFAVGDRAIAEGIPVLERTEALALIHDGRRCHGAIVRDLVTGELFAVVARATVIATGGAGRLYRVTTNAVINEGIGHALALETGLAALGNMEAVQFHPTGIFPAGILVTEGCRGDGGLLRDAAGHRFMPDYEPEKKELASRDVVSRRMEQHIRKGHGVKGRFGEHLWLDITLLGRAHIERNLREVKDICRYFLGLDPAEKWIPVRPAQHYTMGGVRTRHTGENPALAGLFAAGEAACWDMHGFNRLGGNSVAETVVAGMIVGEFVADHCEGAELEVSTGLVGEFLRATQAELDGLCSAPGEDPTALRVAMQEIMTDKVGIFRDGADLAAAVESLRELYDRSRRIGIGGRAAGADPALVTAYRTRKMLRLALTVACGALARTESRGAHSRADYPQRNDRDWLKRTLATWPDPQADLPVLSYEPLDVGTMELPPGWRGYGARDYIDHPRRRPRGRPRWMPRASASRAGTLRRAAGPDALRTPPARGYAGATRGSGSRCHDDHTRAAPSCACTSCAATRPIPAATARIQTYELDEAEGMTLFILLSELREKQDPSLQFDFVCRAGVCGSCGMVVNGRPGPRLPHAHRRAAGGHHALRSASHSSLVAASSLGKCPRVLMILRSCMCRLSIALVV
jgi:fumarate reductase flavoprotein subunit